ncbi:MAG TPA: alpha/beta hydrolase [Aggregatilineales bacterium]|nr:alpha/beta hydrolase [Anaerolineales bacterium]HRE48377.1 alpha/beta hydrolase [Aggregatilineales bacterium]
MPKIDLSGQTIYYDSLGKPDNPPLLLMHGWLEVGRDHLALANELAAGGYRVIVPDLPGYGRSTPPERTYPTDFYQRDARLMGQFLDALAIEKAHVMGFSDGGEIALLIGITRPERCRSVVAWGATGYYAPDLGAWVRDAMPRLIPQASHRARHPGQTIDGWQAAWIEAFTAIVAAGGDLSLSHAEDITCPLLIMVGEHDRLNPAADVQRFAERAGERAQFVFFPTVGHAIHIESPQEFLKTVLTFLKPL